MALLHSWDLQIVFPLREASMKVKFAFGLAIIVLGLCLWELPRKSTSTNATISWSGPWKTADGNFMPLENVAGYKVYWGYSPGRYSAVIDMGKKTQYTFLNFESKKYVTVRCYDIYGNESVFSDEKVILPSGRQPVELQEAELR
jgi:hypothetical protein